MQRADGKIHYFSSVTPKAVKWLWYPYIPFGKITLIEGDPGEGKTAVILDIVARITAQTIMPDGSIPPHSETAMYQFSEDGGSDTIRPRLEKYGANLSRVAYLADSNVSMISDALWKAVKKANAKVVVFDPVQAFLRESVDSSRPDSIRKILTKVAFEAEREQCAVILIGHMNKSESSKTLYRGLGSIDISAAARSILYVERMEEGSSLRVLRQVKNSLDVEGESITFEIDMEGLVNWIGPREVDDQEVLRQAKDGSHSPKLDQITDCLQEWLKEEDLTCIEVYHRAQKRQVGARTVDRAKAAIGIRSIHTAHGWYWHLPKEGEDQ